MRVVYKYKLVPGVTSLNVPSIHKVLCVGREARLEGDNICLWVLVDPNDQEVRELRVRTVATGEVIPEMSEKQCPYIGTVTGVDGWLVFHVFEV